MKNIIKITSALLCAIMLSAFLPSCGRAKLDEPLTFMIANDLHYLSPELLGDGKFFSEPKTKSDGKLVHRSAEIADALVAEAIEKKPRALILAGDLTLSGALKSHTELIEKLKTVKDEGIDVLIIPGNHDVDSTAVDYSGAELAQAEGVDSAKFYDLYSPFIPEHTVSRDSASMSYIYEASDNLRIIMLDTNTYGQGFVKDGTLSWLEEELKKAEDAGIDMISVSHQNLYAHSDLLSFGYQLYNANKLSELYEKYGVQANFSAHIHIQSIYDAEIPEIVTSALSITGLHYGEMIYDGRGIDYSVSSLGVTDELSAYATFFFEDVALNQAREGLDTSYLSADEIELMAKTYAEINSNYFAGRSFKESEYSAGIELWRTKDSSFISKYIDSMLEEQKGNQRIKIKFK